MNPAAVIHFRRHQGKAPNWQRNLIGPWLGLTEEQRAADVLTADWVPNRAMWRSKGYRGRAHAMG